MLPRKSYRTRSILDIPSADLSTKKNSFHGMLRKGSDTFTGMVDVGVQTDISSFSKFFEVPQEKNMGRNEVKSAGKFSSGKTPKSNLYKNSRSLMLTIPEVDLT